MSKTKKELITMDDDRAIEPIKDQSKYMVAQSWLSEKQVLRMLQRTPAEHQFTRDGKGGREFTYVTGVYIQKVLNYIFGWNWDFEIVKQELIGTVGDPWAQVVTTGKLTVKDKTGNTVSKMQIGKKDIAYLKQNPKQPVDIGNDYKASATDALKKCASMLGIASDIYGKDEFREIKADEPEKPKKPILAELLNMISKNNEVGALIRFSETIKDEKLLTEKEKDVLQTTIKNKVAGLETAKS